MFDTFTKKCTQNYTAAYTKPTDPLLKIGYIQVQFGGNQFEGINFSYSILTSYLGLLLKISVFRQLVFEFLNIYHIMTYLTLISALCLSVRYYITKKSDKQRRPRSDCFRSFWVFPVCYSDKHFENQHFL